MPLRKRNGSDIWHIDIRSPGGERVRRSTGTANKKEAEEYHDRLKAELWRVARLGEKSRRSWDETALRMLKESTHLRSYVNIEIHIRYFRRHFSGRLLDSITRDEIYDALPQWSARTKAPKPLSAKSKNLYLSTMRHLFNLAIKWEWLDRAPILESAKAADKRIRWITREEAQRLIAAISTEWLRDVATLGFATGLRRANLLGLEWSQVDLVNRRAWIHPDQAKARRPIGVPLNDEAVEVIRRWIGRHPTHVFSRRGKVIPNVTSEQWKRQCVRAGIENFRFHDIRHTWASWHVQAGTPLNRLMEMGGWSKYEHVLRYAHLAPDHLAQHADAVTIWSQDGAQQPQNLAA
ncbi:site-specific integrase [Burkholderia sp. 9777_1386]|uniref:tyrosine-type recombinase/integrase n=1 Tax=Burkholderia sp. 9777_1386 TaxID=2751183 RepID=UPI0018C3BC54|nr:site-specific integrase [Burkholderia sp. 9777_1386]MBG0869207.1 site-specific integrase [Burkholderia sp. 9777_1386]